MPDDLYLTTKRANAISRQRLKTLKAFIQSAGLSAAVSGQQVSRCDEKRSPGVLSCEQTPAEVSLRTISGTPPYEPVRLTQSTYVT